MIETDLHITHKDFLEIAEGLLKSENHLRFRASGTSMSPFIKDNDTVIIAPDNNRGTHPIFLKNFKQKVNKRNMGCVPNLGIGDVVLLKTKEGRLFLHRVVKRKKTGVVTSGDSAYTDDGFTPYNNILGKVIKISGKGYNFHLKNPFKYLIGKRIILKSLYRFPSIVRLGKKVANFLG